MNRKIILLGMFTVLFASKLFSQDAFIKQISPDFKGFKGVLLIQRSGNSGIDKKLEKRFDKSYQGVHEYIDEDDYKGSQYKDTAKYRFVVTLRWNGFRNNFANYDLIMLDRVIQKEYFLLNLNGNTIPQYSDISRYAKTLEALRAK